MPGFRLRHHAGLADVTQTIRAVGDADRRVEQAERLPRHRGALDGAPRKRSRQGPRPRTLVVFGRENFALRGIYASGGVGFIHDMLTIAGGDNVFADVKREAVQATTELILARRPDVILELRADPMTPDEEDEASGHVEPLSAVPAVAPRRVHIITDPRTVIPGPRVADGVELIAERLHPAA